MGVRGWTWEKGRRKEEEEDVKGVHKGEANDRAK